MNFGQRFAEFWNSATGSASYIIAIVVSVAAFSLLYLYLIGFLLKNNSVDMVLIFVGVMVIGAGVFALFDAISGALFIVVPAVFILIVTVLYSVELKRDIWARRNLKLTDVKHSGISRTYDNEKVNKSINEIIKALQNMSKSDTGAIIILSTGNVPSQIIDSGVFIDSDISSALIESIFFPNTPLHDGAMIINDTKIVAAGCFLPLSQNVDNIPKNLGTRHRAGIGVTETVDVVSIIVSEETGVISIAKEGKITRYADSELLKKVLTKYYWQELEGVRK